MILSSLDTGIGPPTCLLHGLFGRAQNLAGVARRLASAHRVISLDLRNHGASPHADGMAYADMAADVLQTLGALDALPCAMLGHSMGGKVAMMMALTAPALVERLLVADIAPVAYRHHNAGIAAAMQALDLPPGLDRRTADAALADAVPDAAVRGFLLQNLTFVPVPAWKIGLAEIAAGLAEIESWPEMQASYGGPALFLAGGASDYIGAAEETAIRALFPSARLARLEGAGHWLHADRPEAFGAAVAAFMAEPH